MNKTSNTASSILRVVAACTLLPMVMALAATSQAAELQILSTVALRPVLQETVSEFENSTGHKVTTKFDTAANVARRLQSGEAADIVIVVSASVSPLTKNGKIDGASVIPLGKSGVGIVVRAGSPKLKITTLDDLKQALLAAKTVCYSDPASGGAGGTHIASIIHKLGIEEQLKHKLKLTNGGGVTELVIEEGEGAIGVTQVSEIVGKPGAEFVGTLPESAQLYTSFAAAVATASGQTAAAASFLKFLLSPPVVASMKAKGMQQH